MLKPEVALLHVSHAVGDFRLINRMFYTKDAHAHAYVKVTDFSSRMTLVFKS